MTTSQEIAAWVEANLCDLTSRPTTRDVLIEEALRLHVYAHRLGFDLTAALAEHVRPKPPVRARPTGPRILTFDEVVAAIRRGYKPCLDYSLATLYLMGEGAEQCEGIWKFIPQHTMDAAKAHVRGKLPPDLLSTPIGIV